MNSSQDVTEKFLENPEGEIFDKVSISFAKPEQVKDWGRGGEISSINLYAQSKKGDDGLSPDPEGLLSRKIFDPLKSWQMGRITLARPILHPMTKYLKNEYDPKDYLLEHIAVLPASFRSERLGFYKNFQDDLNVLYRKVMIENTCLMKLIDGEWADQTQLDQARKKLSIAVRDLFLGGNVNGKSRRGLMKVLEGKKGLIRGHLAGKRADYSGRAVIVGDAELPLDEAGLPDTLWDKLFPGLDRSEKPIILLNRQPSLHRYSIQAFRASCHDQGNVMRLNPPIPAWVFRPPEKEP
jgi:DNA-directed RNA polymerase beta' subunit